MSIARIQAPKEVKRGDVFEVRIIIQHPMETGFRRDEVGRAIPMNVIHALSATLAGKPLLSATFSSGVAANPYLQFHAKANESGTLEVTWTDQAGQRGSVSAHVTVVG